MDKNVIEKEQGTITIVDSYQLYRNEMMHEDSLIDQRIKWLLISQAILFAALGQVIDKAGPFLSFLVFIICFSGFISSLTLWFSIRAAIKVFRVMQKKLEKLEIPQELEHMFPQRKREKRFIFSGFIAPNVLPIIFVALWVIIIYVKINPEICKNFLS